MITESHSNVMHGVHRISKGKSLLNIYFILFIAILFILSTSFFSSNSMGRDDHTFQIDGYSDISNGLPEEASFSALDVFDADNDGLDEIYVGGAGRTPPKSAGIWAYEYNLKLAEWSEFGDGLPTKDSGKYYGALSFGDIDKDGNIDIIAPLLTRWYDGNLNGIEIYSSDGNGNYIFGHTIKIDESANEVVTKDLDQDGNLDIIVSTLSGIRTFFGNGSIKNWIEVSPTRAMNEITGIDAGDLNNDGLMDLIGCPYSGSNNIRMYIQMENREWNEISFKQVKRQGFGTRISDINNDGNMDILYGTRNEGIKAWLGNGGGSPGGIDFVWNDGSMGLHDSGGNWDQLELEDVTGDGQPELIAANNGGDDVYIYINDLPNGWTWIFRGEEDSSEAILKEGQLRIGGNPYGANFGDWDGNGVLDCAACSWGTGVKAWLLEGRVNDSITYPEGGGDLPDIWGADDYRYFKMILIGSSVLLLFTIPSIQILNISGKLCRRKIKVEIKKKKERSVFWFFNAANFLTIVGIGILLIFQIIAILYSKSFDPDIQRFPIWDPPEFIGVFIFSLTGLFAFLTIYEIARILTLKGLSKLNKEQDENDLLMKVKLSRSLTVLSSLIVYSMTILIFVLCYRFMKTESVNALTVFLIPIILLFSLFLFNLSFNIIPLLFLKIKKGPYASLIVGSLMVLVMLFQMIILPDSISGLKDLLLIYPILIGILIFITLILNISTIFRSRKTFKSKK
jgi:VCBS repeat protein